MDEALERSLVEQLTNLAADAFVALALQAEGLPVDLTLLYDQQATLRLALDDLPEGGRDADWFEMTGKLDDSLASARAHGYGR